MALKDRTAEYQRPILGAASVIGFFLLWEGLLTFVVSVDAFFLTQPSKIAVAGRELLLGGALWRDLAVSSQAFLWGFGAAVVVGIPVGVFMGWRRRAEYTLDPFLTALYASPLVALAPLLIIIFGVGLTGKAALVFLLAVFPFVFNAFAGVKSTDRLLISVVRSFGGGEKDLYFKVILPSILPYLVAGARIAIGRGIVGIIVGEFYAASEGIGFAISRFGDTYRLPEMFAAILVLMIVAVVFTEGLRKLEAVLAPWKIGQETR
jgi:NitT/TauT family transport system permease protein